MAKPILKMYDDEKMYQELFEDYIALIKIQGMAEEVLCRSYFMVSLARRYPMWVAVILNASFPKALSMEMKNGNAPALISTPFCVKYFVSSSPA